MTTRRDRAVSAWGRLVTRGRFVVVGAWVAAVVLCTLLLPTIREAQVGALGDLIPHDAEAIDAEIRSAELFGFPLLSRTIVVQRDRYGLSAGVQARTVRRAAALNARLWPDLDGIAGAAAITNALGEAPFSRERSTTALTYLFFPPDIGQVGRNGLAHLLVRQRMSAPEDATVGVTGAIPARAEQAKVIDDALPTVELVTIALVALTIGVYFRALGPPLLTLLAVALSYLVALRVIAALGKALGISVPSEVQPVIVVLLFGVMTDYTIFYLSRFRRRLREGAPRLEAAAATASEITPTVVAAGLAVVLAGAALVAAELGFLEAFGPGVALSVLVGLAVAVTFVPAMLAIFGRVLFWPRRVAAPVPASASEVEADSAPPRRGMVGFAVAHPWWVAGTCTVLLLACASGLPRLDPGNPIIRGLPSDSEPAVAYREASKGFTPGILSPTVVVVEGADIAHRRGALARFQRLLGRQRGVAGVAGPADQPLPRPIGAALSRTGDAARFLVVFTTDPLGAAAIRRLDRLSKRLPRLLERAGLPEAQASLAGDTALSAETVNRTLADTGRVVPAVLAALFLVLAVFLRALVAPLYMLAVSALVVAASLGLAVYVVQDLRYGEITYYVPFAAAVLLVSLGSDYTMFLAGRVWEAARTRSLNDAIVVGGSRAATSIAVAGGVLAASFAVLALVPLRPFRELAFIMAVGLLLDAFLVRPLLLPAIMRIVGERSAWPSRALARPQTPPPALEGAEAPG